MGKGSNVAVTYDQMHTASSRLKKDQREIEKTLKALKKFIEDLVHDGFVTDKSSPEFHNSFTEFENGLSQMLKGLEGMGGFLSGAAEGFQDLDHRLGNSLKKKA